VEESKLIKLAQQIKHRDQAFVDRFWGNLKTFKSYTMKQLEHRLNYIAGRIKMSKRLLNLLEAEHLALTAVLTKKIEITNEQATINSIGKKESKGESSS
tara:strand:+ start:11663 stop:11959 length:297 start_codon:yes stop_codon:yes gene_type:complete